jgi:hypothetical protein
VGTSRSEGRGHRVCRWRWGRRETDQEDRAALMVGSHWGQEQGADGEHAWNGEFGALLGDL